MTEHPFFHLDALKEARGLLADIRGVLKALAEHEGQTPVGDLMRQRQKRIDAFLDSPLFPSTTQGGPAAQQAPAQITRSAEGNAGTGGQQCPPAAA